jgi:hypothetical protein
MNKRIVLGTAVLMLFGTAESISPCATEAALQKKILNISPLDQAVANKDIEKIFELITDRIASEKGIGPGWSGLPKPVMHFSKIHMLDSEMVSGGFNQFFFNTDSESVNEVRAALKAICGEPQLGIFDRAVAIMLPNRGIHEAIRNSAKTSEEGLVEFEKHESDIDFKSVNKEWQLRTNDTKAKMINYIKRNIASFRSATAQAKKS